MSAVRSITSHDGTRTATVTVPTLVANGGEGVLLVGRESIGE